MIKYIVILTVLLFSVCLFAKVKEPNAVATSIPALGALTAEILKGTPIRIIEPFGNDFSIDELEEISKSYEDELDKISPKIAAVINIRSVIPSDKLFIYLRHRNIKTVEIDCATPLSPVLTAVGKLRNENGDVLPFVWLSLSNSIRMAEVLERDLSALFPKYEKTISANLIEFKRKANALRNDFVVKFLQLDNFNAITLSKDFDYLLKDIDLFVIDTFLPEYEWDEETAQKFRSLFETNRVAVVVNSWETGAPAADIMNIFGVKTAVLKTGFGVEKDFEYGFLEFWKGNVSILLNAFDEK
jgi:ABC-type Zn uptake system ZnuABC Zn-binding protein ZnuA